MAVVVCSMWYVVCALLTYIEYVNIMHWHVMSTEHIDLDYMLDLCIKDNKDLRHMYPDFYISFLALMFNPPPQSGDREPINNLSLETPNIFCLVIWLA